MPTDAHDTPILLRLTLEDALTKLGRASNSYIFHRSGGATRSVVSLSSLRGPSPFQAAAEEQELVCAYGPSCGGRQGEKVRRRYEGQAAVPRQRTYPAIDPSGSSNKGVYRCDRCAIPPGSASRMWVLLC